MRFFTTVVSAFSVVSLAQAQYISPVSDELALEVAPLAVRELARIQERDLLSFQERDLLSTVEGLVSDVNWTSIIDSIDVEGIAGWVNNLLTENNNVQYLDYLLDFLGNTNLVPAAVSFLLSNDETRPIVGDVVLGLLAAGSVFNVTPVFVALKNSGLLYAIIADLIENPNTLPFVVQVLKDTVGGVFSEFFPSTGTTVKATAVVTGAVGTNTISTAITTPVATLRSAAATPAAASVGANSAPAPVGGLSYFGPQQGSVDPNAINTASIANLISAASAQQANGGTGAPAQTIRATTTQVAQTSVALSVGAATTQKVVTTAAPVTNAGGSGFVGTYNLATITGPAFQSLPPSQFGQGPTSINYSALNQLTAALGGGSQKRDTNDAVAEALKEMRKRQQENDEVEEALKKMKRDNIEDLLTTIFSSIVRSNLLNTTIQYLVTDPKFEQSVVLILQGVFEDIASSLGYFFTSSNSTSSSSGFSLADLALLEPLVSALLDSGLLTDIITRAFNDQALQNALYRDLQQILKKRDLVARDETPFVLASQSPAVSSVAIFTVDAANVGSSPSLNLIPGAIAALGLSALML
ncbi:uncharacterized protein LODBEIA_P46540 [Lodderomyces beijingensis]|uniref:GPI-anchored protein n=1 Tax=Lodderomyces beijingensis TaxID=1775926 RepID=A0ABP0ZTA4_9ASCO